MARTLYITHPSGRLHDPGSGHPECPQRLAAIDAALQNLDGLERVEDPPPAANEDLTRAHTRAHVDAIQAAQPGPGVRVAVDPDTRINQHSILAAHHAAGAAIEGVRRVLDDKAAHAFCAIRPPGHHAERDRAMGFCLFNNVAVAARWALDVHGLDRVAIADFDVHHGNGTEDIFRDDPRVLFCSSFQHPFYPDRPLSRREHLIHTPLAAGTDGRAFRTAIELDWLPALERFRPELILVSAGFDAHREDPLAGLNLVESDFEWVTRQLLAIANQSAAGQLVSVLEGGYDLAALSRSVRSHVRALMDFR
ncbi:histone deacetylase family protein [Thioalkalivibrio sp. ALJ3]|uniref:histone deacetylase family protein n=1 Tax=Thioalkalivibrio sp. ALJ3 TaxID=1240557 RepID=UPI000366E536|nr:histone deacetylase family protein [Thioalkalivibrio sp. ALJ3]